MACLINGVGIGNEFEFWRTRYSVISSVKKVTISYSVILFMRQILW